MHFPISSSPTPGVSECIFGNRYTSLYKLWIVQIETLVMVLL